METYNEISWNTQQTHRLCVMWINKLMNFQYLEYYTRRERERQTLLCIFASLHLQPVQQNPFSLLLNVSNIWLSLAFFFLSFFWSTLCLYSSLSSALLGNRPATIFAKPCMQNSNTQTKKPTQTHEAEQENHERGDEKYSSFLIESIDSICLTCTTIILIFLRET